MAESLPKREEGHAWLGAHLFFEGGLYSAVCDRVVLEVVAPLVARVAGFSRRWFFIRYNEGGSHVRLRIFAPSAKLNYEVRKAIEEAAAEAALLVQRLEFIVYEPEMERYGGPHGVVLAEELFHHSSTAALGLLEKSNGDRSARFGKAILAQLVQLHSFFGCPELAAQTAERFGKNYLRAQVHDPEQRAQWLDAFNQGYGRQEDQLAAYVEAAWQALEGGEELTPELDLYRHHTAQMACALRNLFEARQLFLDGRRARRWDEFQGRILPSYLHMMSNRLGVSIREECYLSVLIHKFLGRLAQERSEAIPLQKTKKRLMEHEEEAEFR